MVTKVIPLYEDRADVTLTAYVIAEKGEMNQQGPRPAVLICPGGGYMNCTDREAACRPPVYSNGISRFCSAVLHLWGRGHGLSGLIRSATSKRELPAPRPGP